MATIALVFEGKDLIVPREVIKKLGVKAGELVVIRPVTDLRPKRLKADEKAHRLRVLGALYGSWTDEDEIAFGHARKEMWKSWQPYQRIPDLRIVAPDEMMGSHKS